MSDITANVVVSMPSQLFTMPRSFKAVANGKIYIGKIDTDPVNPANQIPVYLENEDGSHVQVSQPIIINAGGYPVYNGQIAKFVTVQGHSMAVYDAYGSQQFDYPNVLKYDPDQLRAELASGDGSLVGLGGGHTLADLGDDGDGNGDALVSVKQSLLTGAVPRTQHDKNADISSSADVGINSTDDATDKIQSINADGVSSFIVTDTINLTQDIPGRAHVSLGEVSQPGNGAIPIRNLARLNFLPKKDVLYNVTSGYDYDYRADSILKNTTFFVWHGATIGSTTIGMATNLPAASNAMVCAFWRMETTAGSTVNGITKISSPVGGLKFNAVYDSTGGSVYIRQNAYGVQAFGEKTFTACIDIEVDQACSIDCYARMRINSSNDDAGRPIIVDSDNIDISAGRGRYAITFKCPDVDGFRGQETSVNSMEFAFRIFATSKTIAVKVRGVNVTPGNNIPHPQKSDTTNDISDSDVMYRIGTFRVVGFATSDSTAQKSLTVDLGGARYTAGSISIYDSAGNVGRVSTYSATGVRTDNVAPAATVTDSLSLGFFTVILNNSNAAGLGGWYLYNAYP